MLSCTVKLDEEKSKYAGLVQEYGFGSTLLYSLRWLVQGEQQCSPVEKSVLNSCFGFLTGSS
jgi:hypothetical protein